MSFQENGFLDAALDSRVFSIDEDSKTAFDICFEINVLATAKLHSLRVDVTDMRKLVTACLFIRAVCSYQAALLLLKRGMLKDGRVLARALMDIVFRMKAMEKNPKIVEMYIREDDVIRRKLGNKYRLLSENLKDASANSRVDDLRFSLNKKIADEGNKELTSQWFATQAGLSDDYNSIYTLLSNDVHANIKCIDELMVHDDEGNVAAFGFMPTVVSKHDLMLLFAVVGRFAILSLDGLSRVYDFNIRKDIDALTRKLLASCRDLLPASQTFK